MALPAGLQVTEILDAALVAFQRTAVPLRALSTTWRKDQRPLMRGEKMTIPYYPLESTASRDFAGTYDFTGAGPGAETRDITVNKRKYQPLVTTSAELERYNYDPAQLGALKGRKLAMDVVTDILSLVTAANYGAAAFTGAASTFDADDVADIGLACDNANWGSDMRSLILANAYNTALVKDNAIQQAYAYGSPQPIQEGVAPRVHGFDIYHSGEIPANGQNLVGMACYPSAILVGFSPIAPSEGLMKNMSNYEVVRDPDTGIFIEYRAWGSPDSDQFKEVLEVNYGYALGEAAAIKRLVSA
jgi:hypothetical protein